MEVDPQWIRCPGRVSVVTMIIALTGSDPIFCDRVYPEPIADELKARGLKRAQAARHSPKQARTSARAGYGADGGEKDHHLDQVRTA